MSFRKKLEEGKFAVTAEVTPPRGVNVDETLKKAKLLKGKVDAVNVTDNQIAIARLSSLAMCKLLVDNGMDPILQITCRDRNRIGIQSDLLGAWALGIKNVLALTGDHPLQGDEPEAKPVYDLDSVQLVKLISTLNSGKNLGGKELEGKPDFFIGAAAHPTADLQELQIIKLKKKVDAGAHFIQTQAVYDVDKFKRFLEAAKHFKPKILAGIIPLRSAKMAKYMNGNVPGIEVPEKLIKELEAAKDQKAKGIEQAAELIKALKPLCAGVHIMTVGHEEVIPELLEKAGL